MIPIKYIDRRFSPKAALQIKILTFTILLILISTLISGVKLFSEKTLIFSTLLLLQLEAFMWIAYKIFSKAKYGETRKEIIKRTLLYYAAFYLSCLLTSLLIFNAFLFVYYWLHSWDVTNVINHFIHREFADWFKYTNMGLFSGTFLFFLFAWLDALNQAQKQKEEKLIFQYETLKNQINPHFLFNSLNTLSSLVSNDPVLAEQFIQKLASLYRYVIDFRGTDLVDLQMEIDFVKDYFFLQQIRDDGKIDLIINLNNHVNFKILPLSIQLLLENSLKHNSATYEKPLKIEIFLQTTDYITVRNNLQKKATLQSSSKIGLKNLAERTRFITGKEMQIIENETHFVVNIPLVTKNNESITD